MDEIIKIISSTCLKHHDSGEASCDHEARLIITALEEKGFIIAPAELPNSYPADWADKATQEEKDKSIDEIMSSTSKVLLLTFLTCGLKTHMEQMVINDGEEYILSFKKLPKVPMEIITAKKSTVE